MGCSMGYWLFQGGGEAGQCCCIGAAGLFLRDAMVPRQVFDEYVNNGGNFLDTANFCESHVTLVPHMLMELTPLDVW